MSAVCRPRDPQRLAVMVDLYRSGKTQQEIGQQLALSRARVQTLLASAGITRTSGGADLRLQQRRQQREAARSAAAEAKARRVHGCSVTELAGLLRKTPDGPALASAYRCHRARARFMGQAWALTFPQWLAAWQASGKLAQRGRGAGHYAMVRIDKSQPWRAGNVEIVRFQRVVKHRRSPAAEVARA